MSDMSDEILRNITSGSGQIVLQIGSGKLGREPTWAAAIPCYCITSVVYDSCQW
jgi:hypothetical protein